MTNKVFLAIRSKINDNRQTITKIVMNDGMIYYGYDIQRGTKINFTENTISFQFREGAKTKTVTLNKKDINKII